MLFLFFILHINALLLLYVSITIMASLGVFQLSFASKKNTDDGLTKKYCCSQFYISLAMLDWRVYQNIRFIVFAALGDIQYGWSSGSCRRLVDVSAQSTNGQGQFIAFLFFVRCSFIGSEASIDSRVIVTIVNRKNNVFHPSWKSLSYRISTFPSMNVLIGLWSGMNSILKRMRNSCEATVFQKDMSGFFL